MEANEIPNYRTFDPLSRATRLIAVIEKVTVTQFRDKNKINPYRKAIRVVISISAGAVNHNHVLILSQANNRKHFEEFLTYVHFKQFPISN